MSTCANKGTWTGIRAQFHLSTSAAVVVTLIVCEVAVAWKRYQTSLVVVLAHVVAAIPSEVAATVVPAVVTQVKPGVSGSGLEQTHSPAVLGCPASRYKRGREVPGVPVPGGFE